MGRSKFESIEQGQCPKCGSYDLNYDTLEVSDLQTVQYPFTCDDCDFAGREH